MNFINKTNYAILSIKYTEMSNIKKYITTHDIGRIIPDIPKKTVTTNRIFKS